MPAQHVFHERKALVSDGGACLLNNVLQYPFFAPGDVKETYADIEDIRRDFGYEPSTPIEVGLPKFVAWYRGYYGV